MPLHMLEDPLDDSQVQIGTEIRGHAKGTKKKNLYKYKYDFKIIVKLS